MEHGVIICSRLNSKRIPNKPLQEISKAPILAHLIKRLQVFDVYLAIGCHKEFESFFRMKSKHDLSAMIYIGYPDSPLDRMYHCAKVHKLDIIVRVTHDKIFVDPTAIETALTIFKNRKLDYLYSSTLIDGTGFELISFKALENAALMFQSQNIEHISYAIRAVTDNIYDAKILSKSQANFCKPRLLIDYPNDLAVMESIFSFCGNSCRLIDVLDYLSKNQPLLKMNKLPQLTIYVCVYNGEQFIMKCIDSILEQHFPKDQLQIIVVDDKSNDRTYSILCHEYEKTYNFIEIVRNKENLGLASSSNVALSKAKGEYIMRLDADDYLVDKFTLDSYINFFEASKADVIYPSYLNGSKEDIIEGNIHHHIGGAIFKTKAINAVKFTEKLRGYEGLDFFERAKRLLEIDYYKNPVFFYRQHKGQMTKKNLKERQDIKRKLEKGIVGEKLCQ